MKGSVNIVNVILRYIELTMNNMVFVANVLNRYE